MVNKKVYVKYCERFECIEFDNDTDNEDLKGLYHFFFGDEKKFYQIELTLDKFEKVLKLIFFFLKIYSGRSQSAIQTIF